MDDQVFADGIGQITVIGGTVRIDFVAYSPVEKDARGQPVAVFRQRLVLGMEAFNQVAAKVREAADALATRTAQPHQRIEVPEKLVEHHHPAPEAVAVTAPPPAPVEPPPAPPKPPFP